MKQRDMEEPRSPSVMIALAMKGKKKADDTEKDENEDASEDLESIAQEVLDAIEAKDAKALSEALEAFCGIVGS